MRSQKTLPWLFLARFCETLNFPLKKSIWEENKLFSEISLFIWAMDYILKSTD